MPCGSNAIVASRAYRSAAARGEIASRKALSVVGRQHNRPAMTDKSCRSQRVNFIQLIDL
jgi:hypothetical protein